MDLYISASPDSQIIIYFLDAVPHFSTLPPNIATTPTPNVSGTKGIKVKNSIEEVYNNLAVR